jgi:hypothetical protein
MPCFSSKHLVFSGIMNVESKLPHRTSPPFSTIPSGLRITISGNTAPVIFTDGYCNRLTLIMLKGEV